MWVVPVTGTQNTIANSKLDRFFDEQPKAVALVRESIQNSLDVIEDKNQAVKICFSLIETPPAVIKSYLQCNGYPFSTHLEQCGLTVKEEKVKTLLIEDFNTVGLTGEIDKTKTLKHPGNFIGFWWTEGDSQKTLGSGGSHGVGKIKLSTSSEYNFFLALTRRQGEEREMLIGYSQLKIHALNDKQYLSYARFGKLENESDPTGKLFPYDSSSEDKKLVEKFKQDFSIRRKSEAGLSVVIPAIHTEINSSAILEAVLGDFYLPILQGRLVVEMSELGQTVTVNADTISGLTSKYLKLQDEEILKFARKLLELRKTGMYLTAPESDLGSDYSRHMKMTDFGSNLQQMQKEFNSGKMIGARIPFKINYKNGKSADTVFDVFVVRNDSEILKKHDAYIRRNLYIRGESTGLQKPYTIAFLYVEDETLSEFLKYAEDPGHEKWKTATLRQKDQFKDVLDGVEEEEVVRDVSPEIFSIIEPKQDPDKPKPNPVPPVPPVTVRSKSPFALVRKSGGFEVKASKVLGELVEEGSIALPFTCRVMMGYKRPFGNSISSYSTYDFLLEADGKFVFANKDTSIHKKEKNILEFQVTGKDFSLEVTGFDVNRDLELRLGVVAGGNE
jgi:hypothetical protein